MCKKLVSVCTVNVISDLNPIFQCPYCKESYFTEPNMEAHIQAKHSGVEVEYRKNALRARG